MNKSQRVARKVTKRRRRRAGKATEERHQARLRLIDTSETATPEEQADEIAKAYEGLEEAA